MHLLLLLLVALAATTAQAQRFVPGPCPTVKSMEGFDKSRFYGRWVEVEKTPSMFDLFLRCMSADYSDDNDGSMNVVIRGVSLAGLPVSLAGDALPVDSSKKGFYSVRYGFGVPFQGTLMTMIDTDYEKYAIVYSCTNSVMSNLYHTEYVWLLSRNDTLPNYIRQNAYDTLDARKVTRTGLNLSDRNNCPPPNSVAAAAAGAGREDSIAVVGGPIVPVIAPAVPIPVYVSSLETTTGAPSYAGEVAVPAVSEIVAAPASPLVESAIVSLAAPLQPEVANAVLP